MLRKISILLAFIILIINIRLSGDCFGFEQGYQYGVTTFTEIRGGHGTAYFFLWEQYIRIVWGMSFLLIGKTIKNKLSSQIVCIPSLIWTIYFYWQIYLQKKFYVADVEPFSEQIRQSIPIDIISFSLVSVLLIYQLANVLKLLFPKNQMISNIS